MMELAISNIAWSNEEDAAVAGKLRDLGVHHVEIAPTKVWENPMIITAKQAQDYVDWWGEYGIKISAFQSMLFARPDLKIFESENNRHETAEYMKKFIGLAGVMSVKKMVFGSPKNRQRGDIDIEQANHIAVKFFNDLGDMAMNNNVVLCIEPNAPQYNCDYVTNAVEGIDLIKLINNHGVKLHLDTACMSLAGDDIAKSILDSKDILEHFHVSAPMLGQVGADDGVDHILVAKSLKGIMYDKLISIEMRPGDTGTNVDRVEKAVKFVRGVYLTD